MRRLADCNLETYLEIENKLDRDDSLYLAICDEDRQMYMFLQDYQVKELIFHLQNVLEKENEL